MRNAGIQEIEETKEKASRGTPRYDLDSGPPVPLLPFLPLLPSPHLSALLSTRMNAQGINFVQLMGGFASGALRIDD